MYNFIDVTEQGQRGISSEALIIKGKTIEEQIPQYNTLYVAGRETLSPDLKTLDVGVRDGTFKKYKRYPERVIRIGYQIITSTNEEFITAFQKLNNILNLEDEEIRFADDKNFYYIGTTSNIGKVDSGALSIKGEFEILCLDPFKYSNYETIITPTNNTFTFNYNGTYKTRPTFVVDFAETTEEEANCGYITFANQDEKFLQAGDSIGDSEESISKSERLLSQDFKVMPQGWSSNISETTANCEARGTAGIAKDAWGNNMLTGVSYPGKGEKGAYHGVSLTRNIPPDSAGHTGAKNFKFRYKQRFAMTPNATNERGGFHALLVNNDGGKRTIVCGVAFLKNDATSGYYRYFYINQPIGKKATSAKRIYPVSAAYRNNSTGYGTGAALYTTIEKDGENVIFDIAGGSKVSLTSSDIKDMEVNEITFAFTQLKAYPIIASNGIFNVEFVKNDSDTVTLKGKRFSSQDHLEINGDLGEILINDERKPAYGALSNNWEEFTINQGENKITYSYSDYITDDKAPEVKLKYRERFL